MADFDHLMGRIENEAETQRLIAASKNPDFAVVSKEIYGAGAGKTSNNVAIVKSILGRFPIIVQDAPDCTSFGLAGALNCLKCIRMFQGKYESFGGFTVTEDIYANSRVIIGQGQIRGGGSMGIWCAEAATKLGTLIRKKYGSIDLSVYSKDRANLWGDRGSPEELRQYEREHKVKTYSPIRTWEQFRDSLVNGYPVTVASNRGFQGKRDKDGFLMGYAEWPHQIYFIDVKDSGRAGGLLVNSWPVEWVQGNESEITPAGTGWVDSEIIVRDMLSSNDSFAYSDYESFEPQDLDWNVVDLAKKIADNYV